MSGMKRQLEDIATCAFESVEDDTSTWFRCFRVVMLVWKAEDDQEKQQRIWDAISNCHDRRSLQNAFVRVVSDIPSLI